MQTSADLLWQPSLWQKAKILERKEWGHGHVSIIMDQKAPSFFPGQFTQVGVVVKNEKIIRPLSCVNCANQPYEFYVSSQPNGIFSPQILSAPVNSSIWINRELKGDLFYAAQARCRHLYLISTSTGLAPFLSILRSGVLKDLAEKIFLIHGVRNLENIAYLDELKEHQKNLNRTMSIIICVSSFKTPDLSSTVRDKLQGVLDLEQDRWCYAGRVTDFFFLNHWQNHHRHQTFSSGEDRVVLCGNCDMVKVLAKWFREKKDFSPYNDETGSGLLLEMY